MKQKTCLGILFILISLNISSFANKFLVESFKPDLSDLSAQQFGRNDFAFQPCAIIKVKSDIGGLTFEVGNAINGSVVSKPGEYWIYVSAGEKLLRVIKPGYEPLEVKPGQYNLTIEGNSVYVLKIKPEVPDTFLGNTQEQGGGLNITSNPSGALVTFRDEPGLGGLTPFHIKKHAPGVFIVKLEMENYGVKDTAVQIINGETNSLNISFIHNTGYLLFKINPPLPQSNVYIDGRLIQGIIEKDLYPIKQGPHVVLINSINWTSEERKINVGEGRTDSVIVTLKPLLGKIKVNVFPSQVGTAEIWLNNEKTQYVAPGEFPLQIGDYTISLRKANYPNYVKYFTLKKDENLDLNFTLNSFEKLKKKINSYKVKQDFWAISAIAFGAAGGYLVSESNKKYQEYQTAVGSDANTLHSTIESYQKMAPVAFGLAAISAFEFSIQLFKKGNVIKMFSLEANGQQATLKANL